MPATLSHVGGCPQVLAQDLLPHLPCRLPPNPPPHLPRPQAALVQGLRSTEQMHKAAEVIVAEATEDLFQVWVVVVV